jgi:hypothetical protein
MLGHGVYFLFFLYFYLFILFYFILFFNNDLNDLVYNSIRSSSISTSIISTSTSIISTASNNGLLAVDGDMKGDNPVGVAANDESTDDSDPSDKSPANDSSWVTQGEFSWTDVSAG